MFGEKCCVLFSIVLLWIGTATGRLAFCPGAQEGSSVKRMAFVAFPSPAEGQNQELRCHLPHCSDRCTNFAKLLWFKGDKQVSNTSDGRITISENTVKVADNISQSCRYPPNTTLTRSTLSIHNVTKSDYGGYDCRVAISNGTMSAVQEVSAYSSRLRDPTERSPRPVHLKVTNMCKTVLTCKVDCITCCPCDSGLCNMTLIKDGREIKSTTAVSSNDYSFKSLFKITIDDLEDFGKYQCVLRQQVADCVDGTMFENSQIISFDLRRPEVYIAKPEVSIKADEVRLSCLFMSLYLSTDQTWNVVLTKDGKEVASKRRVIPREDIVREYFFLNKSLEVDGRYECQLRQEHPDCIRQSWFIDYKLDVEAHLSLQPKEVFVTFPGETTINRTCSFLVEPGEDEDKYVMVLTLNNDVVQSKLINDTDVGVVVSAEFLIEIKDTASFGIYDCRLEKNGVQHPNDEKLPSWVKYWTEKVSGIQVQNLVSDPLQITPSWIRWPPSAHTERANVSLGDTMYLTCYAPEDELSTDKEVAHLSWYRNGGKIEDNRTTFVHQRFWKSKSHKWVSFLWCIVTVNNTEAFGTYECRIEDDKVSGLSLATQRSYFIQPENWTEQALQFYSAVRYNYDNIKALQTDCHDHIQYFAYVADGAIAASVVLGSVLIMLIPWLWEFVKQKLMERDIRMTLNNIHEMEAQGSIEGSHRYDVFISYSSSNASWVKEHLLTDIEKNGYTVCLHERDFPAGESVLTNIANGIYQSRKVIVVMSKSFIKSGWCMHELVLTYQRKLDHKENCVVVVKYEDCKIPNEIALRTYLDWTEPTGRARFWEKLHDWLGPPCVPEESCVTNETEKEKPVPETEYSETSKEDKSDPNSVQDTADFELRQRQNLPSHGDNGD